MSSPIKTAIIGAGYIADWHADAIRATAGAELVAVCDVSASAADGFAASYGLRAFTSVAELINAGICDAVHILTPPHLHHDIAIECFKGGLHCFVEKPVATSAKETAAIAKAAKVAGKQFAAGHNFLGLTSYQKLKKQVQAGTLGRVSTAEINWCFPLIPLRSGPYGLWLMREPKNLLLELGPHLFAFAQDLFGPVEVQHLELSKPIALPAGETRPQGWRIMARAGDVDINFNISLVESFDDRSITLRGSSAMARLDYANDRLTTAHENTADLIINPLRAALGQSWQHLRVGTVNAARQLTSLNQKNPYGLSFRGAIGSFYESLASGAQIDPRFDADAAQGVMQALDDTIALMPPALPKPKPSRKKPKPKVMVIGGTGFIGRALTRRLVADGHDVRVLSRGKTGPFEDLAGQVETVGVSLSDAKALRAAMDGIDVVYNLAKSMDNTWDAALKNDVGVAVGIAQAALEAGVKRLIYTGTIASYDMSDPHTTITEKTAFDTDMSARNIYARSKAECERQLTEMHDKRGLPLVIARPGIVVGHGGPLQHWGIGRWHGAGAVRIWGNGHNTLPFVLINDVADGLVRMMDAPEAVGQSFNLISEPMLSARGYFDAIHSATGARIAVKSGALWAFYASDTVKYALKTWVLCRKGQTRPSYADWKSRAHFSPFDNAQSKSLLGWAPEADKDRFIDAAITKANLFGF